jgi:hypothetical protein
MSKRKLWLTSPATWLALPLLVMVGVLNLEDGLTFATRGYWEAATAKASEAVAYVGIVVALSATWEASRLRSGGVLAVAARRPLPVIASSLVPTLVVGLAATLLSHGMLATLAVGAPGGPSWHIIAVNLSALLGILGWGLFLGFVLPPRFSLAVCLASTYFWYLLIPAHWAFPLWLRYLSGGVLGAPSVWEVSDPRAHLAAALTAVGLFTVGAVAALARDRRRVLVAAALVLPLTLAGASMTVRPLDAFPVVARQGITCDDEPVDGLTLCLWPELEEDRAELVPVIADTHRTFTEAGLDLPDTVSAGRGTPEHALWLPLEPRADAQETVPQAFVTTLMPSALPESCPPRRSPDLTLDTVHAWLLVTSGLVDARELRPSLNTEVAAHLDRLLELPAPAQGEWYKANRPVLETCSADPDTLDPTGFTPQEQR